MKKVYIVVILLFFTSCTKQPNTVIESTTIKENEDIYLIESSNLPNLGKAPELENEIWLNTDQPLRLSELEGKVVLLEMWTFG